MPAARLPVSLEVGRRRVFASALAWPGWTRSGKDEESALRTLEEYASRYAPVAAIAGLALPGDFTFDVVERLPGDATTEFGAPGRIPAADVTPGDAAIESSLTLLQAAWRTFDQVVATAPAQLRKGPRGGGRDREPIVEHVLGAEAAYLRKLGQRLEQPEAGDSGALAAFREAISQVLLRVSREQEPTAWPPAYFIRRDAWHVLDHAWEIEDRS